MKERKPLPGFFSKREMLEGRQTPKDALSGLGRDLVSRGLLDEALDFFARAEDREGMQTVLEESRRRGDTFSFEAALRVLDRSADRSEWRELGEKALAEGKLWFAYRAFEKADHQPGLEEVRRAMDEEGLSPAR